MEAELKNREKDKVNLNLFTDYKGIKTNSLGHLRTNSELPQTLHPNPCKLS